MILLYFLLIAAGLCLGAQRAQQPQNEAEIRSLSLAAGAPFCASCSKGSRVVLVDIDGIHRDTFQKIYLAGKLPNMERVLGKVNKGKGFGTSLWFENATAVFPAVTMAGQASMVTGVLPAKHGIVGNKWFDRSTNRVIDYFSTMGAPCVYGFLLVSVGECSGGYANRHLQVRTLYELATAAGKTSTVVFNPYWKGATHAVLPTAAEVSLVQGVAVDYKKFDTLMMNHALDSLEAHGMPDLLTLYFTGADGIGHKQGTSGQLIYLAKTIDVQIGRFLDLLQKVDPLWANHTQFIITSDHGRTDTQAAPQDSLIGGRVHDVFEAAGYAKDDYKIVDNGGVVHLYLKSRLEKARWTAGPTPEDAILIAKQLADDTVIKGVVDFVALRKNGPGLGYLLHGAVEAGNDRIMRQIAEIDSPRSGDLLLLLKQGRYFGNTEPKGAQHGSRFDSDLAVPLVIALGGTNPGRSPVAMSHADVPRIIAAYLGIKF